MMIFVAAPIQGIRDIPSDGPSLHMKSTVWGPVVDATYPAIPQDGPRRGCYQLDDSAHRTLAALGPDTRKVSWWWTGEAPMSSTLGSASQFQARAPGSACADGKRG
jgi:hypothetical protein